MSFKQTWLLLEEKLEGQEWAPRIVTIAINTGMRQGEIFDLTWFDVDRMRGLLHVRVSKNGKDRFIPINHTIRMMLERLPRTSEYVHGGRRRRRVRVAGNLRMVRRQNGSALHSRHR